MVCDKVIRFELDGSQPLVDRLVESVGVEEMCSPEIAAADPTD